MKQNRMKDALDAIAHRGVPETIDLWSHIEERIETKTFMQVLRARPALAFLLVLLALALLSSVAYAIGIATGYIPGIGMVDQSTPLRVLAERVTVERDGIELTINQIVFSADKTVLVYKVEGIPADAYANDENTEEVSSYSHSSVVVIEGTPDASYSIAENSNRCFTEERLLLPDGSTLNITSSEGSGWISGFEKRLVYEPVPEELDKATFLMSCLDGTVPGRLPENWEVPLQFVPAALDLRILPVVDVSVESQYAMTLEKEIETDDGYILMGKFRSIGLPKYAMAQGEPRFLKITDANGQHVEIKSGFPNLDSIDVVFGEFAWGYEIKGKQHAWPLTLTLDSVSVLFYQQTTEFEFDTGPASQVGQKWVLNRDILFKGYTIRVVSIERTSNGYSFIFKVEPDVILVSAEIKDFPSSTAYSGNDGFGKGDLYTGIGFKGEPPSGKLTIELGWLHAVVHGPWQVQWSPENTLTTP